MGIMPLNFERAFKTMDKYGLDALVATMPENVLYVSDFLSLSQWALRGVPVFIVLPRDAQPAMVSPISDIDLYADRPSWIEDVRGYGTFYIEPPEVEDLREAEERLNELIKKVKLDAMAVDALVKVLNEKGLDDKTLGVDEMGVTHLTWECLKRKLPMAQMRDASHVFREIRMVKTRKEVETLKKAAEITEKGVKAALDIAEEGVKEVDLAREIEITFAKEEAKPFAVVLGCGSRSAFPNAMCTDYKIRRGDIIRFDGGCIYQGYYSDIAKIAILGEPTEKQKRYYGAVVKGAVEATKAIQPGVKASELFDIALETVRKTGIPHYKRHHCGHGIGIECYDMPLVGPADHTLLEEGVVLNIETPYYEIGFGGLQVEETLVVTKRGYEYLTTHTEELMTL